MTLEQMDFCFIPDEAWVELKTYYYLSEDHNGIRLTCSETHEERTVGKGTAITLHPSSPRLRAERPAYIKLCKFVLDCASSLIAHGKLEVSELVKRLSDDDYLANVKSSDVENMLKCYVASKQLIASESGRANQKRTFLQLSQAGLEREKIRSFAGSMASELESLSARIRLIIAHNPTVGTYREDILRTVLEKHLPERYHVATGFIFGCDRQIDILIYDRIDYAPLFRESDLVVVPKSAVRAVIEVKTNLTTQAFRDSLSLISEITILDSGYPPIFKGIFAFESDAAEDTLCEIVKEHHAEESWDFEEEEEADADADADEDEDEDEDGPYPIGRPFDHLTCACINQKSFLYTTYRKNDATRFMPILVKTHSNTGLPNQVALFMEHLLCYLQFGGAKPGTFHSLQNMLGSDTRANTYCNLAQEDWGAYFEGADLEEKMQMEERITNIMHWLEGGTSTLPTLTE
ncbi:DUF6602 domain-containing protein [Pseudomonas sp. Marseille-Q1929]|uniref:DUF6602 domain-containing protein n=1 Tax=Pseudomonas sp. Marseille-Q1929 TaxID=2730402 RepID=UPI001A8EF3A6|nr:DUF6602 domain-containing protein [Pseudomonas sp. Marseille-Q1929]MBO0494011.1 hypothetical protein [Pseudomonas sp. Marseille-Q1929]